MVAAYESGNSSFGIKGGAGPAQRQGRDFIRETPWELPNDM